MPGQEALSKAGTGLPQDLPPPGAGLLSFSNTTAFRATCKLEALGCLPPPEKSGQKGNNESMFSSGDKSPLI